MHVLHTLVACIILYLCAYVLLRSVLTQVLVYCKYSM
jgi:hypothetical protein